MLMMIWCMSWVPDGATAPPSSVAAVEARMVWYSGTGLPQVVLEYRIDEFWNKIDIKFNSIPE